MRRILENLHFLRQSGSPRRRWKPREYVGWVVLIAYSLFLTYRGLHQPTQSEAARVLLLELPDRHQIVGWIYGFILTVCQQFAYFVPIGFIAVTAVPRGSGWLCRFPIYLPGLAVGGATTILVCATGLVNSCNQRAVIGWVFPILGCFFGAWVGTAWLRGWRSRLWFVPKVASLAILAVLCVGAVAWLSLQETPLPLEFARVTPAEKRRLLHIIGEKDPESLQGGQTHTLRLTEHDLNLLLSWALSSESSQRRARVSLEGDSISLRMSMATPLHEGVPHYLNLMATGNAEMDHGVVRLRADQCHIGALKIPRWLLRPVCVLVTSRLNHDERVRPLRSAVEKMVVDSNTIQLTYGHLDLSAVLQGTRSSSAIVNEELLASTRAQVNQLTTLLAAGRPVDLQPSFDACLKMAFAIARDRSTERSPVSENRAAILALAILFGHSRLEQYVGPVLTDFDRDTAQWGLDRILLRGRSDWARHFLVNAAITLLSGEAVSNVVGVLKEELDADTHGSGFSFADLLADRAGTAFAVRATRDDAAARAMQDRLIRRFHIEEIFPPADGLVEDLSDAELLSQYGGVGGEGYQRVVEEIEQRIATCAAYQ